MVRRKKQRQTVPHGRKKKRKKEKIDWLYILNYALILFFLLSAVRNSLPLFFFLRVKSFLRDPATKLILAIRQLIKRQFDTD